MKKSKAELLKEFQDNGHVIPSYFKSVDNCIKYIKEHPNTLSQTLKYSAEK